MAKIRAKSMAQPTRQSLSKCMQAEKTEKHISPMSLALAQVAEMTSVTNTDLETVEQEAEYEAGGIYMGQSFPAYWSHVGSSKTRNHEQSELGKQTIRDMMLESSEVTTFAFTDGSCLINPGPCGAGAVFYPPRQDAVPLKRPV